MPASPDASLATMIANFKEKTGKALPEWLKLVQAKLPMKHGEMVKWLKSEFGMGHGYANLAAHEALPSSSSHAMDAGEDLVAGQYAGAKAALKPWYDALIKRVQLFGGDVEIAPKKTYVSLRRNKQFALIQPSTATRLDVGIQLKGVKPTARLEASGSFNAMVSHRVRVEKAADVDDVLVGWLKQAYEAS